MKPRYGKDQYGEYAPQDLVELEYNFADSATEDELRAILDAPWYMPQSRWPGGTLLISFSVIEPMGLEGMDAINDRLCNLGEPLLKIWPWQNRYSPEDGFYTI